ncbi:MAG: hypothetical protein HYT79_12265 [Elusimicrobia bacterium]|nr:hypothetical protein [Elusimicrobiota bacterium]
MGIYKFTNVAFLIVVFALAKNVVLAGSPGSLVNQDCFVSKLPAVTLDGVKDGLSAIGLIPHGEHDAGFAYFLQFVWSYERGTSRELYRDLDGCLIVGNTDGIILLDDLLAASREYASSALTFEAFSGRVRQIADHRRNRNFRAQVLGAFEGIVAENNLHNARLRQLDVNLRAMGIERECVFQDGGRKFCVKAPLEWFYDLGTRRFTPFAIAFDGLRQQGRGEHAKNLLREILAVMRVKEHNTTGPLGLEVGIFYRPWIPQKDDVPTEEKPAFFYSRFTELANGSEGTILDFLMNLRSQYAGDYRPANALLTATPRRETRDNCRSARCY